jgi:hypothetical protein
MDKPNPDDQAPSAGELDAYQRVCPRLVEKTVERILARNDSLPIFGEKSRETLTAGILFTAQTLEAVMAVASAEILAQQLDWLKIYLNGVGVPPEMVLKNMEIFADVLREYLPPEQYPALAHWAQRMVAQQRAISGRPA